jgi:FtsH-binding integral membrane protein
MSPSQPDNLGGFIAENKKLLKEYLETRMEIYRLQSVRLVAKSAGYLVWILLSLFLAFLFLLFGGMMAAYWFSNRLHSLVKGFGMVALIILVIFILIALFRKILFVEPVIHSIIQGSKEESDEDN